MSETAIYTPQVFDKATIGEAKAIILTPEGNPTEWRWRYETPYLTSRFMAMCEPAPEPHRHWMVLDYGCGIGRVAKYLIAGTPSAWVHGYDPSEPMRRMAVEHVANHRFSITEAPDVDAYDSALAVWVLQHARHPGEDILRLHRCLKPGGRLFVVNNIIRALPVDGGQWADDGVDVAALLRQRFAQVKTYGMDPDHVGEMIAAHCYIAVCTKEG